MKLPVRFKPALRLGVEWLGVALLAAFAAWPLLTRPGLPRSTDADLHIYRTQQIMAVWQQGVLYTRWAPDMAYGFGYPLFNYYAPLTYYLGAAYGALVHDPVAGVKFVLVLATLVGVAGMYLLGRERWNGRVGLASAAAFALAPYLVYIDPQARGAVPETLAVALGPLLLWALARLRRAPGPGALARAALVLAAMALSHNLLSFVFLGLGAAWQVWEILGVPSPGDRDWRPLAWLGGALVLGLGLAAFMWLPAALERNAVQYARALAEVSSPEARLQFVSPQELLAPAVFGDVANLEVAGWKFRLGVPQWSAALLGVLALWPRRADRRAIVFFALVSAGLGFLMLPVSAGLWQAVPGLRFLQLPWRLLGPLALTLAWLAGAAVAWAETWAWRWGRAAAALALGWACLSAALPLLDPLPWAAYGPVTLAGLFQFEAAAHVGTTVQNEFLPVAVTAMPGPQASLRQSYEAGGVDKVDYASLPEGAQATVVAHGPLHDRFQVNSPAAFTLQVFTFYFPGWTAYVDGARVATTVSEPNGFILLPVPAGAHEILLRLEDTWPRQLGWVLSGLALAALVGLLVWQARRTENSAASVSTPPGWSLYTWLAFLAVAVGMLGMRLVLDQFSPWRQDFPAAAVTGAQYPLRAQLEGQVALLGYDLAATPAHPGDQVPLTLYWKATGRVPLDLSVFVHFVDPDGQVWGQSDKVRPATFFPTDRWPLNRYWRDEHVVALKPNAPTGLYTVRVGLWDRLSGQRMRVLENGVATAADSIVLTTAFDVK